MIACSRSMTAGLQRQTVCRPIISCLTLSLDLHVCGNEYPDRCSSAGVRHASSSITSTTTSIDDSGKKVTRHDLLQEASALTKSLYRTCLRSIKLIRWGNALDEKEFAKREADFLNPSRTFGGVISMSPPPNREDELRSRAEYYHSYAREYFVQESDCLDNDPLKERDIKRFLYYLRKGDKDRKWLLGDMMFPDPYKDSMDQGRIQRFEAMSKKYLGLDANDEHENEQSEEETLSSSDDFFDDDDENPEWFKKKFPNLK